MKLKKMFAAILCAVMVFSSVGVNAAGLYVLKPLDTTNGEQMAEFYDALMEYIIDEYKYDLTKEELLDAAVQQIITDHPELYEELCRGMFNALDENSLFYTEEEYKSRVTDVSGVYVGIGINVFYDEDKVIFGEPIEGTPAENSGLQIGDIVVAIDGESVEGYGLDVVTAMIKGEEGTTVNITVLRNGVEYTYEVERAVIKINPITYEIIEGTNVGYVKLSGFNASAAEAFDAVAAEFGEKGVEHIVLDLRNNVGGYLNAAVSIASYFIPDGEVVVTEEHNENNTDYYYYAKETDYKFDAVVLINKYSASASELLASALRDYGTGILVGQTSYGKGTMQTVTPIRSGHYLWMTVAEYFTPSHTAIHKVGLEPDYSVVNKYADFDMSTVTPYEITRVLTVGCTGEDVYAVKERLKKLGYNIEVNDVYDIKTADVVTKFQAATELFPYGVADITTQIKLNDVLRASQVEVDKQLERAIGIAKNLD